MRIHSALLDLGRLACGLTFIVIIVGAYTRLTDAGLGCPDWPGCYGRMIISTHADYIAEAQAFWPERPLQTDKAWIEMAHRYIAGLLGLMILAIAVLAWADKPAPRIRLLTGGLLLLVVFQALLGMWTVTLLLKPFIVVLHLLGGMAIIGLLHWLTLELRPAPGSAPGPEPAPAGFNLRPWAVVALLVLILQIALGGWTSTNYAALACPDFPACQGKLWPPMDFGEAFVLWRGLGVDYEGGVLDGPARTAIHMTHRIGAVITAATLLALALLALRAGATRPAALAMLALLFIQLGLGVANVVFNLPLAVAVAHNGVAALLLLSVVTLLHRALPARRQARPAERPAPYLKHRITQRAQGGPAPGSASGNASLRRSRPA